MLLVVDAGNTHTKYALWDDTRLAAMWRIATDPARTADEHAALLHSLLAVRGLSAVQVDGICIASVVPKATPSVLGACETLFPHADPPVQVSGNADLGLEIGYQPPSDVGADRLCDAVAGVAKYGSPIIIIDFGTATTFNAVAAPLSPGRLPRYLGGAICLGIGVSLQTLFASAAKIPQIDLAPPTSAIGSSTTHALQSGIVHGALGQTERLVALFRAEMDAPQCPVVATGGHVAALLSEYSPFPMAVEPLLTLNGLRLIYERARPRVL